MDNLFSAMKTSPRLETEGIWLDLQHTKIRLARAGGSNVKFNQAAEKMGREHKRVFALDLMSTEKGKQLLYSLYADTVVLEWLTATGDKDEAGELVYADGIYRPEGIIPATRENIIATFAMMEDLFMLCKETAESLQGFKQALLDGVTGN